MTAILSARSRLLRGTVLLLPSLNALDTRDLRIRW